MASTKNNLFNYSRPLPPPFHALKSKKVPVSSKYGDGTEATLCAGIIKGIHAVCGCMDGRNEGAVGTIDHRSVAEYSSSNSPHEFHLAVYDSKTGTVMASVYDKSIDSNETYALNSSGRDGAAIFMAAFPVFMQDEEFKEKFTEYYDTYVGGFTDLSFAIDCMACLCDNIYRRVVDSSCAAHVKITADGPGNLIRISQAHLDAGLFAPRDVFAGEFTIFAQTGPVTIHRASSFVEHRDFVGKYMFHTRMFTPVEQALVPVLPAWYIIPQEAVDICKHAQATTGKPTQMRNFLLRGPAGTGKTMGAKAIAAGLGLPYMKYTCSAGTEIYDFIGQIFPEGDEGSTGDARLDQERKTLRSMGGINYANVAKLMNLPDLDDMDYDPAGVYEALTGTEKTDATSQECMGIILEKVTEKVTALAKREPGTASHGQKFSYTETDFLKALKNGYVVEIQEPTTIMQPGVLVGLNSLLEQEGSITLPTGEIIQRHPDAVVVVTTNVSYEGCRGMNRATRS